MSLSGVRFLLPSTYEKANGPDLENFNNQPNGNREASYHSSPARLSPAAAATRAQDVVSSERLLALLATSRAMRQHVAQRRLRRRGVDAGSVLLKGCRAVQYHKVGQKWMLTATVHHLTSPVESLCAEFAWDIVRNASFKTYC